MAESAGDQFKNPHGKMTEEAAKQLEVEGYIRIETDPETGEEIWILTDQGRDYLAKLQEHEV
jgi:DNA-binding PadR family transcriptional regulator